METRAEIAEGTKGAEGWPGILFTSCYPRASPCGVSVCASSGLPRGPAWSSQDSWTAYMTAQGSNQVWKRTRQTLYHFL